MSSFAVEVQPLFTQPLLTQVTRVGALATNARSCFLFLPPRFPEVAEAEDLVLASFTSDHDVVRDSYFVGGSGAVGWVGRHHQLLNLSPYEETPDSFPVYLSPLAIGSVLLVPIELRTAGSVKSLISGVLACDRITGEPPFSSDDERILQAVGMQASLILSLSSVRTGSDAFERITSWEQFMREIEKLRAALGVDSLDILRLTHSNFDQVEHLLGTEAAVDLVEQYERLVSQALPPQFPLFRLPQGDILVVLDKMMASFFKLKLVTLNDSFKIKKGITFSFERLESDAAIKSVLTSQEQAQLGEVEGTLINKADRALSDKAEAPLRDASARMRGRTPK